MTPPSYNEVNKKIYGKFKDEAGGVPVLEFCGLRPKMYSMMLRGGVDNIKRAKGVKKAYVERKYTHINYLRVLFKTKRHYCKFKCIRSDKHKLGTYEINKVGLCSYDDKKFRLDEINCLSHGHYKNNLSN